MILTELEIGPHFLTLYATKPRDVIVAQEIAYRWFIKAQPQLSSIQQDRFIHVLNDPNVYHPYGQPDDFKEYFRHFHIRYGKRPTQSDVDYILANLDKMGISLHEDFKVTDLEDSRLPGTEHLVYPPISGDYLDYIDQLRTGQWITGE